MRRQSFGHPQGFEAAGAKVVLLLALAIHAGPWLTVLAPAGCDRIWRHGDHVLTHAQPGTAEPGSWPAASAGARPASVAPVSQAPGPATVG